MDSRTVKKLHALNDCAKCNIWLIHKFVSGYKIDDICKVESHACSQGKQKEEKQESKCLKPDRMPCASTELHIFITFLDDYISDAKV